jgi:hypothetical protein
MSTIWYRPQRRFYGTERNIPSFAIFNGSSVANVDPDGLGTKRRRINAWVVWNAACFRFAACLGACLAFLGLRSALGGFARELAGLNCSICLKIRLF